MIETDWITVVGMDPSFTHWGLCAAQISPKIDPGAWCVKTLETATVVTAKGDGGKGVRVASDDLVRGRKLFNGVHDFLDKYDPKVIFVEVPHGSKSASAMKSAGICKGILSSIGPFIELQAIDLKKVVTGKNSATKRQMVDWAVEKHPNVPWEYATRGKDKGKVHEGNSEHIADAIIAIHAGLRDKQFQQLIELL